MKEKVAEWERQANLAYTRGDRAKAGEYEQAACNLYLRILRYQKVR